MSKSRRPSACTRSKASSAQEMQDRDENENKVICISDDELDQNDPTPTRDNSQSPGYIHGPPVITDEKMLEDRRSRQNQPSSEPSSSYGVRQDARYQMGRKRNEILETVNVARYVPPSKKRKVNSTSNAHKKPKGAQGQAQSTHSTEKRSNAAPVSRSMH